MHDAVTVTLIILVAALLRRPLLTSSDVAPGVRTGEREYGITALAPVIVKADHPQSAWRDLSKR